jgi:CubicO group peptidase (beta-lactamase class C family)
MKIRWIRVALSVWLSPLLAAAQSPRWEALDRAATDLMRSTKTPGLQVAVVSGENIVLRHAMGVADVETGAPMTPELLAQVGSLTKPFTAALVLGFASNGVLKLGTPISQYIPGLKPAFGRLTLSQLVSQTAGLGDREGNYGTVDEAALLRDAKQLPDSIAFLPPGLSFSYSNIGFALAGLAAQEAAKQPFADLMQQRLLRPLGMTKATFRPLEAMTYSRAQGHKLTAKGDTVVVVRPTADDTRIWPAGYMYTNVYEAARFVVAMLNGGRIDGRQVLAPGVTDSMLATHIPLPGMANATRYGYGMFLDSLRGYESAWHPGSMPGFSTLVRMIPSQRVGVVVIANRDEVRLDRIAEAALEDVLRSRDVKFEAPPPITATLPAPAVGVRLADYVGTYSNRFSFELKLENGSLVLNRFGAKLPVVPLGGNIFGTQSPGSRTVDRFMVVPAAAGRRAYAQMFLWTFPRKP